MLGKGTFAAAGMAAWIVSAGVQATPITTDDLKERMTPQDIHGVTQKAVSIMQKRMAAPLSFDVERYDLDLTLIPGSWEIDGAAKIAFTSLQDNLTEIKLDAVDFVLPEAVKDASGKILESSYDFTTLTVKLGTPLNKGEKMTLSLRYIAKRAAGLYFSTPQTANPKGMYTAYTYTEPSDARTWFPSQDRPDDKALVTIKASLPAGYNLLANGVAAPVRVENGRNVFRYDMTQSVISTYLVSLSIGQYEIYSLGQDRNVPVYLWTPATTSQRSIVEARDVPKMMAFYDSFTGTNYPWSSYSLSVAQHWGGSMEHQTATTMGEGRMVGDGSGKWVVAHELAHQWFGDLVTTGVWGELWLNEGFATMLPNRYMRSIGDEEGALSDTAGNRAGYFKDAKVEVHPLSNLAKPDEADFGTHTYNKGAMVLHYLRHLVNGVPSWEGEPKGTETFTKGLKTYLASKRFSNVSYTDLQAAMSEASGTDLAPFFEQWVRSAGHPIVNASYSVGQGEVVLNTEQVQATRTSNTWRTFNFPVEVELIGKNGSVEHQTVVIANNNDAIKLKTNLDVAAVVVDPSHIVPAEITVTQSPEAWNLVLTHSKYPFARIEAGNQLVAAKAWTAAQQATLLADKTSYVKLEVLAALTTDKANAAYVKALTNSLRAQRASGYYAAGVVMRAERWLLADQIVAGGNEGLKAEWERRYLASPYYNERIELVQMLDEADPERGHAFVASRLNEASWGHRDRLALIDLVTKKPLASQTSFYSGVITNGSILYFSKVMANLTAAKFDDAKLVPVLQKAVESRPRGDQRVLAVQLLATQESSKGQVCPLLAGYAIHPNETPSPYDVWVGVRTAAKAAAATLKCE